MMWSIRDRARRHLKDAQLLEVVLGPPTHAGTSVRAQAAAGAHLDSCPTCTTRLAEIKGLLDTLAKEGAAEFQEAYPDERLVDQRARIMRRIERAVGYRSPARVLRFPSLAHPALATVRGARRWPGVATAAGLLVGVVVGQFVRVGPDPTPAPSTVASRSASRGQSTPSPIAAAAESPTPTLISPPSPVNDDEFMLELELSLSSPQIWELSALDAITPRTREVAINVR